MITDKNKIHTWFWVRSGLPKRLWKKCMEYRKMDKNGKIILWHVNKDTEVPQKVGWIIHSRKNRAKNMNKTQEKIKTITRYH